jgi:hypothetical protein
MWSHATHQPLAGAHILVGHGQPALLRDVEAVEVRRPHPQPLGAFEIGIVDTFQACVVQHIKDTLVSNTGSQACEHATVCRSWGPGRTLMSGVVRLELSYDMFIDPAAHRETTFSACRNDYKSCTENDM